MKTGRKGLILGLYNEDIMRINKIINKEKSEIKPLPLSRTISFSAAEDVLKEGVVTCSEYFFPSWFEPFDRAGKRMHKKYKMTYFFYGYPGYISNFGLQSEQDLSLFHDWPVGMILEYDVYENTRFRTYPFDTGALLVQRYSEVMNVQAKDLSRFELKCLKYDNTSRIRQFICRYFGDNFNYLSGRLIFRKSDSIHLDEEELLNLLSATSSRFDHRSKLIECHVIDSIDLSKGKVHFILPQYNGHYLTAYIHKNVPDATLTYYNELTCLQSQNPAIFGCEKIMDIGLGIVRRLA
ncbi:MAG: hypothetical protein ACRCYO_17005 [Bacteroidia bacterium]